MSFRDDCYPIEKHLEQIKLLYEYEKKAAKEARERVTEYNQAEEIKKRDEEINNLRSHSLWLMSDKEVKANRDFIQRHYDKHPKRFLTYNYSMTGTGIGTSVVISCPICNESEDITDTDSW